MAGIGVPKVISNMITTAQFAQMIAGFVLNAITIALIGKLFERLLRVDYYELHMNQAGY